MTNKSKKGTKKIETGGWFQNTNHKPYKHATYFEYKSYYHPHYYNPYYESIYSGLKQTIYSPDIYYSKK